MNSKLILFLFSILFLSCTKMGAITSQWIQKAGYFNTVETFDKKHFNPGKESYIRGKIRIFYNSKEVSKYCTFVVSHENGKVGHILGENGEFNVIFNGKNFHFFSLNCARSTEFKPFSFMFKEFSNSISFGDYNIGSFEFYFKDGHEHNECNAKGYWPHVELYAIKHDKSKSKKYLSMSYCGLDHFGQLQK